MNFIDKAKEAFATAVAAPAAKPSKAKAKKDKEENPAKARVEEAKRRLVQSLAKRRGGDGPKPQPK